MQANILAVDFPDKALYSPRFTVRELQSLQQISPVLDDASFFSPSHRVSNIITKNLRMAKRPVD
jgi:hypothetical protein